MYKVAEEQTLLLIKGIAERMRDPERVKSVALDPSNNNPDPHYNLPNWGDLSLSGGYPGVLLLFTELDRLFPDEKWDQVTHSYVLKIKESLEKRGFTNFSLFGGLAGICFSLHQASRNGTRYQKLIQTLNSFILEGMEGAYFELLKNNLREGSPSSNSLYDVVQGIVGIGVYALTQLQNELFLSLVMQILNLLIGLTHEIKVDGKNVPGWYLSSELQVLNEEKKRYPLGNFNLGLAHGVPGVLAFLSIAYVYGVIVQGQKEAIEKIASWLEARRYEVDGRFFWDTRIRFEDEILKTRKVGNSYGRDAWCYGVPGIANSLFLAGKALQNQGIKNLAINSFRTIFLRSRESWNLPGPTFCHGIAGLLLITHELAQQTNASDLKDRVKDLKKMLFQFYQVEYPFGFQDVEPCRKQGYFGVNRPTLLEGSAGILLTALSTEGLLSWWHAPFLISDGKQHGE